MLPKINKQWDAKLLHKLSTVKGAVSGTSLLMILGLKLILGVMTWFQVKKNVLIWYHGDGHWYKGKFISKVLGVGFGFSGRLLRLRD